MASAMEEAWWAAMLNNLYEDGSLVIEDDTLDVNGGSTVNLRVKLGARPRSDVTVALSETSALISLGSSSLTFTRDNWDTYQSVVVIAPGNRQSFTFAATHYFYNSGAQSKGWSNPPTPGLGEVDDALLADTANDPWINEFSIRQSQVALLLSRGDRRDLSNTVESSGSMTVQVAGLSDLTVAFAGIDTAEPYLFTPSNDAEVLALYNAMSETDNSTAGTYTLRDYVPGSTTVSLSASGPDEYSGVTGSATVTVD